MYVFILNTSVTYITSKQYAVLYDKISFSFKTSNFETLNQGQRDVCVTYGHSCVQCK